VNWGNQVPPYLRPRRREGLALAQESGETGFPQTLTQWEDKTLPGEPFYPIGNAGRSPAHPGSGLREGLGGRRLSTPPREATAYLMSCYNSM